MEVKMKKKILVISLPVLLILSLLVTPALAKDNQTLGQPLQEIWDAIKALQNQTGNESSTRQAADNNLQNQINNIQCPLGAIIMWSGSIDGNGNPIIGSTPDANWHICDGTNGTPDLRDRFIVGSGSSYSIGDTGGVNSVSLGIGEIPSHNHTYSGTTVSDGAHYHRAWLSDVLVRDLWADLGDADGEPNFARVFSGWAYSDFAGNHYHYYAGTTDPTGGGAAHENRPPYFALAYIMKVS
jgi:microcystin-dependent protein